jgi:diketogulonate reductase-like aldo/keto reductase
MAYSPVEQGRLLTDPTLARIAGTIGATPAQVALAWVLRHADMIVIPKAGTVAHVEENHAAVDLTLSGDDVAALDAAFPPPTRRGPLEML